MSQKRSKLEKLYEVLSENTWNDKKHFLGQVLTIVDASIADTTQRKSVKDLVNTAFYGESPTVRDYVVGTPIEEFAEATGMKFDTFKSLEKMSKSHRLYGPENPFKELEN